MRLCTGVKTPASLRLAAFKGCTLRLAFPAFEHCRKLFMHSIGHFSTLFMQGNSLILVDRFGNWFRQWGMFDQFCVIFLIFFRSDGNHRFIGSSVILGA